MALADFPIVRTGADLVCPEHCAGCESFVHPDDLFCGRCLALVHHLGAPACERPGNEESAPGSRPSCVAADPIRRAGAFAAYDRDRPESPLARAIAHFKYGGAGRLGRRFARALRPRLPTADVDLLLPVPLHPRRLRQRGFNQSAVLARHLARALGRPVALRAVIRSRDTPSQVGLGTEERARNVVDAFAVRDRAMLAGRTVLVIDDVWTSGATARAVARVVRDAGATAVDVLTIARVL